MYHFSWADQRKVGIQLKYTPESKKIAEMYPGKVTYMSGGLTCDPKLLLFKPTMHCHSHLQRFICKVLNKYSSS